MHLQGYLERIEFNGTPRVNLETLNQIHHQHLLHIPYEDIDVQLGSPLDFDLERIFDKFVVQRRGGWCYEMNGLMGWALEQIGFPVMRMAGGVWRETLGDEQIGNHLLLQVEVEGQQWLADVGLGDGARFPIPIASAKHVQNGLEYSLNAIDGGYWRFSNQPFSNATSFDFKHEKADESLLSRQCQWLQTDPESHFRKVLIVQRFTPKAIEVLLGKVHTTITASGKTSRELENLDELHSVLRSLFGINVDLTSIWDRILAAHESLSQQQE